MAQFIFIPFIKVLLLKRDTSFTDTFPNLEIKKTLSVSNISKISFLIIKSWTIFNKFRLYLFNHFVRIDPTGIIQLIFL